MVALVSTAAIDLVLPFDGAPRRSATQRYPLFATSLRTHGLGRIPVIRAAKDTSPPPTGLKLLQS
jgi:hypothetical protein